MTSFPICWPRLLNNLNRQKLFAVGGVQSDPGTPFVDGQLYIRPDTEPLHCPKQETFALDPPVPSHCPYPLNDDARSKSNTRILTDLFTIERPNFFTTI